MPPREDLINSAVSCEYPLTRPHLHQHQPGSRRTNSSVVLQDPSVAAAPIEKRRAFLESKNLTPEEVEISLARVGMSAGGPAPAPSQYFQQSSRSPPAQYGYGYPPYQGQWAPPPEPPRRDWRDWFIMATVTTGVGYGLYEIARVCWASSAIPTLLSY